MSFSGSRKSDGAVQFPEKKLDQLVSFDVRCDFGDLSAVLKRLVAHANRQASRHDTLSLRVNQQQSAFSMMEHKHQLVEQKCNELAVQCREYAQQNEKLSSTVDRLTAEVSTAHRHNKALVLHVQALERRQHRRGRSRRSIRQSTVDVLDVTTKPQSPCAEGDQRTLATPPQDHKASSTPHPPSRKSADSARGAGLSATSGDLSLEAMMEKLRAAPLSDSEGSETEVDTVNAGDLHKQPVVVQLKQKIEELSDKIWSLEQRIAAETGAVSKAQQAVEKDHGEQLVALHGQMGRLGEQMASFESRNDNLRDSMKAGYAPLGGFNALSARYGQTAQEVSDLTLRLDGIASSMKMVTDTADACNAATKFYDTRLQNSERQCTKAIDVASEAKAHSNTLTARVQSFAEFKKRTNRSVHSLEKTLEYLQSSYKHLTAEVNGKASVQMVESKMSHKDASVKLDALVLRKVDRAELNKVRRAIGGLEEAVLDMQTRIMQGGAEGGGAGALLGNAQRPATRAELLRTAAELREELHTLDRRGDAREARFRQRMASLIQTMVEHVKDTEPESAGGGAPVVSAGGRASRQGMVAGLASSPPMVTTTRMSPNGTNQDTGKCLSCHINLDRQQRLRDLIGGLLTEESGTPGSPVQVFTADRPASAAYQRSLQQARQRVDQPSDRLGTQTLERMDAREMQEIRGMLQNGQADSGGDAGRPTDKSNALPSAWEDTSSCHSSLPVQMLSTAQTQPSTTATATTTATTAVQPDVISRHGTTSARTASSPSAQGQDESTAAQGGAGSRRMSDASAVSSVVVRRLPKADQGVSVEELLLSSENDKQPHSGTTAGVGEDVSEPSTAHSYSTTGVDTRSALLASRPSSAATQRPTVDRVRAQRPGSAHPMQTARDVARQQALIDEVMVSSGHSSPSRSSPQLLDSQPQQPQQQTGWAETTVVGALYDRYPDTRRRMGEQHHRTLSSTASAFLASHETKHAATDPSSAPRDKQPIATVRDRGVVVRNTHGGALPPVPSRATVTTTHTTSDADVDRALRRHRRQRSSGAAAEESAARESRGGGFVLHSPRVRVGTRSSGRPRSAVWRQAGALPGPGHARRPSRPTSARGGGFRLRTQGSADAPQDRALQDRPPLSGRTSSHPSVDFAALKSWQQALTDGAD